MHTHTKLKQKEEGRKKKTESSLKHTIPIQDITIY